MNIQDRSIVVTGAGHGIGAAMAARFARDGARGVTVVDIDGAAAAAVADSIDGVAVEADVANEEEVHRVVTVAQDAFGPVDIFCSNAGIAAIGGEEIPNDDWQRTWEVNVMSHVYAARAVIPAMLERGEGYLVQTASAAGLLTNIGAAAYSVTKHAAVAFAEWLAVTYGDAGLRVSALCPQFVNTAMLKGMTVDPALAAWVEAATIEPDDVAEAVVEGIMAERFLILPHPEVADFFLRKATDYERWLDGMRRLQSRLAPGAGEDS